MPICQACGWTFYRVAEGEPMADADDCQCGRRDDGQSKRGTVEGKEVYRRGQTDAEELIVHPTPSGWGVFLKAGRAVAVCIGVGESRQAAVTDAVAALEWATATLQETPAPDGARR